MTMVAMLRIPLYARPLEGDWKLHLVTQIDMPRMIGMPDVIVWGTRFFTRTPIGDYVEAFAWIVPPTPEAMTSSNLKGDTNASAQDQHGPQDGNQGEAVGEAFRRSEEGGGDARS